MVGWLRQVGMTTRRKVKVGRSDGRAAGGMREKKEKKKDEAKKL